MAGTPQITVPGKGGKPVSVSKNSALKKVTAGAEKKYATQQASSKAASRSEMRARSAAQGRDRSAMKAANAPVQEEEDWLAGLLGGGSGGGGGGGRGGYSAGQIAATQAALQTNRARMEALYKRYAEDIAGREAAIGETYNTAGTNLGSIYDTSVENINKAYDAARAAQTQQLLNLGMTEQTPVQSFGNQTGATTSLQNLRAAVLAQNEASRRTAITNQRLASEAATREGVGKLSAYDAKVAQAIAEMQSAGSSGGGGGGGSSSGGGLNPYQYASLRLKQQQMDQDAQIAAAKLAQPRATVDRGAILTQISKNPDTQNLSQQEKISLAKYLAG